jgi:cytochrome c biogenesis protein
MRFAISLLVMLAIAAIIGTVMKQNQADAGLRQPVRPVLVRGLPQAGPVRGLQRLVVPADPGLPDRLHQPVHRPQRAQDAARHAQLARKRARGIAAQLPPQDRMDGAAGSAVALASQTAQRLGNAGYRVKLVDKTNGVLVAAKKGAANKFGYIFAHSAIVIILLGGLLDSDLPIRFQQWFMGKTPYMGSGLIAEIPQQHRLGLGNPSFRGNTMIPEGQNSNTAILPQANGVLMQELPFTIHLNKFIIDFYSTGMPKLFASEVTIRDHETGKTFPATIKVNQPLIYRGVAVYQSSFEDGGSKLKLTGYPMTATRRTRPSPSTAKSAARPN